MTYNSTNFINPFQLGFDNLMREILGTNNIETKINSNIYTSECGCVFEFALPGAEKKNIEITFENQILTIKVKTSDDTTMTRCFKIDYKVNNDQITSSLENGILRITLPKQIEEKKTINIKIS